jgi:hypothetical protein
MAKRFSSQGERPYRLHPGDDFWMQGRPHPDLGPAQSAGTARTGILVDHPGPRYATVRER